MTKVNILYEQARVKVVFLRTTEVSKLRERIETLLDEVEGRNLELQTMQRFVGKTTKPWNQVAEAKKAAVEDRTHVTTMDGWRNEILMVTEDVAELLSVLEKSRKLRKMLRRKPPRRR